MNHVSNPQDATRPIDVSRLDDLRMLSDEKGPDLLLELISIFLDDTPAQLMELAHAIATSNAESVMHHGHSLKSSCAQLGALQLSELCRQLEAMGRAKDIRSAQPVLVAAQAEFEKVRVALLAVKSLD